ncbi:MAG: prepilin-type N-terminal cleavage/methylation domain-containing protein [Rhodocyclaceae bacterium]|nr:MAG: prepilin-type N-terminal cleavage/methylation domain-containing protein [Rhodocyclaceae bacterium]
MKSQNLVRDMKLKGFTLTEMAVVLVIVSLLIGSLLIPLGTQQEMRYRSETEKNLAEIRDALLGYALLNKKLPCPMPKSVTDPTDANYGVAASSCSPGTEGYLPWKTLGVREVDAWGTPRSNATDSFSGYWLYRVDVNFTNTISISTAAASSISIKDNNNNALTGSSEPPIAVVFSTGANRTADGLNGDSTPDVYQSGEVTSTFDDMLIWLSRPLIFSRMVAAGQL